MYMEWNEKLDALKRAFKTKSKSKVIAIMQDYLNEHNFTIADFGEDEFDEIMKNKDKYIKKYDLY